ncbi:hypothetical protein VCUG_01084 [Vavraia culicis subsp. floridensis]|uniref:Uncharacterized protein n=1 Tax=Vavraia culicis (isolate floridensis) TaxID=948595 RepID=L2GVY2_VAVCU|nr:uncharacterized protein VCUG_01084 [Vavraia culicis subsp. floridensis]ELA47433.1 hypothetical protein VCUG_01084 [Vavraia culicis subsp. floridensis]
MSHFFKEDSTEEKKVFTKKLPKKQKNKDEFDIRHLPTNEKQKFNFISTYLKQNKQIDDDLIDELLGIERLPRTLKNKLMKMKVDVEEEEKENWVVEKKVDDTVDFDQMIGNLMEKDLAEGIKGLQEAEVSLGIDGFRFVDENKENDRLLVNKEKILKAKLGLYNKNIMETSYDAYKTTLQDYIKVNELLSKDGNIVFYVKMLLRIKHDRLDMIKFLSTITEARKIYQDQLFFYSSGPGSKKEILRIDGQGDSDAFYESLDEEYKLVYLLRTDYDRAIQYFYDKENADVQYNDKILKEFAVLSFQREDLKVADNLITRISAKEDDLDDIIVVLEILGIRKPKILKDKFVILEKNELMLKSKNRRMELMRAYFMCVNWNFDECSKIIKDEMGINCYDIVKERYCNVD